MRKRIIVIGGGPAGMMAAIQSADQDIEVILLERNEKLGKKLYITGKGRCNVTNACPVEEWMSHLPRNPKFMYSAFHSLDNHQTMSFFEDSGLPLKIERGERVFPQSDKSSDVIRVLEKAVKNRGVRIRLNERVTDLRQNGSGWKVITDRDDLTADAVILACGGLSYPSTGSTGDGIRWAERNGHRIVEPVPALIPVETWEEWPMQLQGLSLRNVTLTVKRGKKQIYQQLGEMLFTHYGISGPLVLSASSHISGETLEDIRLLINLKPGLTEEMLDERMQKDFSKNINREFRHALSALFPQKMIDVMVALSGIDPKTTVNQITKSQRRHFVQIIQNLELHPKALRPIAEAIVTRGGVSVRDVDPKTMESRRCPRVFFAGEMLDVDGYTGGFNLQIAFSTGYLAGKTCREKLLEVSGSEK